MSGKMNCWEIKQCGREPHGAKVKELGVCPVTVEMKLDGVHDGSHAGRCCWVVAASLCGGKVQGSFAAKFENCENCDFYATVRREEFPNFQYSSTLLARLRAGGLHLGPQRPRVAGDFAEKRSIRTSHNGTDCHGKNAPAPLGVTAAK